MRCCIGSKKIRPLPIRVRKNCFCAVPALNKPEEIYIYMPRRLISISEAFQTEKSHLGADPRALLRLKGMRNRHQTVPSSEIESAQATVLNGHAQFDRRWHIRLNKFYTPVDAQNDLN